LKGLEVKETETKAAYDLEVKKVKDQEVSEKKAGTKLTYDEQKERKKQEFERR